MTYVSDQPFNLPASATVAQALTIAALVEFDETQNLEPVDLRIARVGSNGDLLAVLNMSSPAPNPVVRFWAGGDSYACDTEDQFDYYLRIWDDFETPTVEAIERRDDVVFVIAPGGSFEQYNPKG
jgi:hypothetical protein